MARSPKKKVKGQTSLMGFFKKKDAAKESSGDSSPSSTITNAAVVVPKKPKYKMNPKYRPKLTMVQHCADGDDDKFVKGKLVSFDGETGLYTVQLDGQENKVEWTAHQMDFGVQCHAVLHQSMAKYFNDGNLYLGKVTTARQDEDLGPLFRVDYEDGDSEEMSLKEVKEAMALFQKKGKAKKRKASPKATSTTSKKGRKVASKKSEEDGGDLVDSEEEAELEEKEPKKKKTKRSSTTSSSTSKKAKKKKSSDDDSDFEEDGAMDDDSEAEFDDMIVEEEDDDMIVDEVSDDDLDDDKPKKKKKAKGKGKAAAKPKATGKKSKTSSKSSSKGGSGNPQDELDALTAKQKKGFNVPNNPQQLPSFGTYVDPVGVDPTDGIVETIINAQVRKIGNLLLKATRHTKANPFGLSFPLKLQTACSGTDAPSIALGLVQESLDKFCKGSDAPHGFSYSHEMSCEIEPFKQAYIGRNFPGVLLFPDICKLTTSEQVLDVYGRPQTIPEGNLFVAGTSCKDFSMLKTTYRLDIEDKGTSGETFLAAVEFLDQKQPPVAIFENVLNAPWPKMQEYITGRIALSQRNTTSGIKDSTKVAKAEDNLKFSVNSDGEYVAEAIPRQVGIRAGDVVEGFVQDQDDPNNVQPLVAEEGQQRRGLITLGQLAKRHEIDLKTDTLVMRKKVRYCTHLVKVDTKDFGIPQTRQRKYLFIWRCDDLKDNLGEYFEEIFYHLETPLLYPMDAFLLPDDHDRIRDFREALRSGRGLLVKRERAKELDFFDWELSKVKDLGQHLAFRSKLGIEERARYTTGWQPHGILKLAPGIWPELADMWNHRRLDMIDCFAAAACRDAVSRDALHHSYSWDLSQNVTRTTVRNKTPGASGCVTPGGEMFLPYRGRTLMGCEKLALQGIPHQRLDFGILSEVQQSDLAGNAMSVSVVCATMLAAICAPELRRAREERPGVKLEKFAFASKYDDAGGAVLAERGDLYNVDKANADVKSFMDVFKGIADDMAEDAFRSSVLCTCESSGTCTEDPKLLEATGCGMNVCGNCFNRYRMEPHETEEIDVAGKNGRPDPHEFERRLRCAVPSLLRLGEGWEEELKDGQGLESYTFDLQLVARKKRHWTVTYGAWEDFGAGRQVAEIRVDIGKIGARSSGFGLAAGVRCFAPAIRHKKPLRGKLKDAARLFYKANTMEEPSWEFPDSPTKKSLQIVGSEPTDSQRVLIGLNDDAAKALKAHDVGKAYIPKFQADSRNSCTHYHPLWKQFPGVIQVSGDDNDQVNGTYRRLKTQQTVVHSALWRRDANEDKPAMYIYIRPDVLRTGLDTAVISTTPAYKDGMEVCELHDWIPENALKERTHKTKVTFLNWKRAPEGLKMEVPESAMFMKEQEKSFDERVRITPESDSRNLVLCEVGGLTEGVSRVLLNRNAEGETFLDLYGKDKTATTKRLSIVAAPSLFKFAAQGKLPLELSKWYRLPSSAEYGHSEIHVPKRPEPKWKTIKGRKDLVHVREYDEEESVEYYQQLSNRPSPFQAKVEEQDGKVVLFMDPYVAAHRAAAQLGDKNRDSLEVDYCLAELSSMGAPDTKVFHVPNSDAYEVTSVTGLELPLYKRQAKALTRMLAIENGEVSFPEEERSEHVLPGIGWCMIGRATRQSKLQGGVLGDAIGSGKTVVTIALILAGAEKARARRNVKEGRSSATLIVVPPGLVRQWDDERKKFTKNKLKCIIIDSTKTLKKYTVEDLCKADMVIVPAGIIEEGPSTKKRPYTEHLSQKAGASTIPPAPRGYSQREAPTIEGTWIRNMASGPSIYVGNKGDQQKRDAQAYYSHCYTEAIAQLREKSFGAKERGVPLEYFTWERVVIDECHETLVTNSKFETDAADFKELARRGAREFLGIAQTDATKRPIRSSNYWGLTGTPLLETEARVTELANLMGGTYLTGAANHWRREETDSGRDLFLNQQEATRSREYRRAIQESCHSYVREACQRNRGEKLLVKMKKVTTHVNMSSEEGEAFLEVVQKAESNDFGVSPDLLGENAFDALKVTAGSKARQSALVQILADIQQAEPETKIIIFAGTKFGGYESALSTLKSSGKKHCHIGESHTVEEQNEIISWFRHVDATDEDKARPRILLLSFEQAAGHNLQEACHNVILYDPMYSGNDPVADASVEEQAVGRVMRQGQKYDVTVTRIAVKGPEGEPCLDDWIIKRNTDEEVLAAATSNFDD